MSCVSRALRLTHMQSTAQPGGRYCFCRHHHPPVTVLRSASTSSARRRATSCSSLGPAAAGCSPAAASSALTAGSASTAGSSAPAAAGASASVSGAGSSVSCSEPAAVAGASGSAAAGSAAAGSAASGSAAVGSALGSSCSVAALHSQTLVTPLEGVLEARPPHAHTPAQRHAGRLQRAPLPPRLGSEQRPDQRLQERAPPPAPVLRVPPPWVS